MELSCASAKGAQLVTNLVTWSPFHSIKTSGLNFWATFSTEWNSIFAMYRIYSIKRPRRLLNFWTLRVGTYSRWALIRDWALIQINYGIPKFSKIIFGKFSFSVQLCSRSLKFLVEWFAFRKSFRKSGNFSGKILYQLPLFPKFLKFSWLNGKRPKCIQEILVLRESSARTTYDVQKSVLHVQIRPIDLSITI